MIIYTIEIQDGERQYTDWNFERGYNYSDYEEGKITDRDLLYEFFGTELEDSDCVDLEQKTKSYWIGDVIAYIGKVSSITEADLELIREYV
tara:strand:- start:3212 stop:3484 length:273 start_codon:yes stop_codon:yes gene_type:complete